MVLRWTISVSDTATPAVADKVKRLQGSQVRTVMARAVVNHARTHFRQLNETHRNKLGGRRTNFWSAVARSTNYQVTDSGFELGIAHVGVRQRWLGGTIRPVNARMLTIPATAEAHGRRAREFNTLRFAVLKGFPALIEAERSDIRIGKRGVRRRGSNADADAGRQRKVFFWLARSVYQGPDPSVMPSMEEFSRVAVEAAGRYLGRTLTQNEGTIPSFLAREA